jgi:hypothetical protein
MTVPEPARWTEPRRVRRELGPTAWVVLEELVAAARPGDGGQLVATVTARGLAAELGIGRDAAVAVLSRLRRHGLISFTADRQAGTGRFGTGGYVVSATAAAVVSGLGPVPARDVPAVVAADGDRRVSPKPGRAVPAVGRAEVGGEQRSLFDLLLEGSGDGGLGAEELGGGGGEGRGYRHELASEMRPAAGDIRDDIDRSVRPC